MREFNVDKALGQTPMEFRVRLQNTLHSAKTQKKRRTFRPRGAAMAGFVALQLAVVLLVLVQFTDLEDGLFKRLGLYHDNLQPPPQHMTTGPEGTVGGEGTAPINEVKESIVRVQMLRSEYIAGDYSALEFYAVPINDIYEIHAAKELYTRSDNNAAADDFEHILDTDKGKGDPQDVMYDGTRTLLLFDCSHFTVGTPEGPELPSNNLYTSSATEEGCPVNAYLSLKFTGTDALSAQYQKDLTDLANKFDWSLESVYKHLDSYGDQTTGWMEESQAFIDLDVQYKASYERAKAMEEALALYTDENGMLTLVMHYYVTRYDAAERNVFVNQQSGTVSFAISTDSYHDYQIQPTQTPQGWSFTPTPEPALQTLNSTVELTDSTGSR